MALHEDLGAAYEAFRKEGSPGFRSLYEDTPEGNRIRQLFLKNGGERPLSHDVSGLRDRLLVIADPHDPIFPGRAIGGHLVEGTAMVFMSLGRHEFPFNLPCQEMGFLRLARAMRESWAPSPAYEEVFSRWVSLLNRFLVSPAGFDGSPLAHSPG